MLEPLAPGPEASDWPFFGLIDDVRPGIAALLAEGAIGALATLVEVDGPSPRQPGAQMLIAPDGRAAGYVSGGCVEGSLELIARDVIAAGAPREIVFGEGSAFEDVRLICGARIKVLVEPIDPFDTTWRDLLAAGRARVPVLRRLRPDGQASLHAPGAETRAAFTDSADGAFCKLYTPPPRLIVLGADPVALSTVLAARAAGFETILVRRMGPNLAPADLADHYCAEGPKEALNKFVLDDWSAVITTTHDLDDDHEALMLALPSSAFYVGALGSRRRLADRQEKLARAGLNEAQIARLHAPVGLNIGAATPGEIAVSIVAAVIQAKRTPWTAQ